MGQGRQRKSEIFRDSGDHVFHLEPARETTNARRMPAREAALELARRLKAAGHEALFAGGCVRDRLLGHEPKDYDIATSARPAQVIGLFPGSE